MNTLENLVCKRKEYDISNSDLIYSFINRDPVTLKLNGKIEIHSNVLVHIYRDKENRYFKIRRINGHKLALDLSKEDVDKIIAYQEERQNKRNKRKEEIYESFTMYEL